MSHVGRQWVLILDFGSQYTQLIARRVREAGVYCEILPFSAGVARVREAHPNALILSGGPASVYDEDAPTIARELFELGIPTLGICYGLQLIAHVLGGKVESASDREYGPAVVRVDDPRGPFARLGALEDIDVWMSHGDRITDLPEGFYAIGTSPSTPFCAVGNDDKKIYGLQFHPEVAHTPKGRQILEAFLFDVAKCEASWTAASFIEESIAHVREKVGEDGRAVLGLSGGVDSSVAALLCQRALGDRLVCIFVDNGLLRAGEGDAVERAFAGRFGLNFHRVDASE
ncbi:MAG: glutamine-hydrolyzing GMP synthase, partial [Polyangiaceae bacterium]